MRWTCSSSPRRSWKSARTNRWPERSASAARHWRHEDDAAGLRVELAHASASLVRVFAAHAERRVALAANELVELLARYFNLVWAVGVPHRLRVAGEAHHRERVLARWDLRKRHVEAAIHLVSLLFVHVIS